MSEGIRSFGDTELGALDQAVGIAREMTGHYFGLPDDWFERVSHQVCTLRELRGQEVLGAGKLAQIRKLHRILDEPDAFLRFQRVCPHYRICLQDHNILALLRERAVLAPRDLLLHVLLHEYVHLVRFGRWEQAYEAGPESAAEEEGRVAEIARSIASRLGPRKLRRAAALLERA
jgi:hypothetical protein